MSSDGNSCNVDVTPMLQFMEVHDDNDSVRCPILLSEDKTGMDVLDKTNGDFSAEIWCLGDANIDEDKPKKRPTTDIECGVLKRSKLMTAVNDCENTVVAEIVDGNDSVIVSITELPFAAEIDSVCNMGNDNGRSTNRMSVNTDISGEISMSLLEESCATCEDLKPSKVMYVDICDGDETVNAALLSDTGGESDEILIPPKYLLPDVNSRKCAINHGVYIDDAKETECLVVLDINIVEVRESPMLSLLCVSKILSDNDKRRGTAAKSERICFE